MHSIRSIVLTLSLATIIAAPSAAVAHEGHNHDASSSKNAVGELVRPTEKDATWVADQKAKYPTDACVVSEDKLGGDMGKPVDYIYRVEGKPDRLVTFCCKDCVKDFNKDPQKYLKILDEAAAKKSSAQSGAKS